MKVKYVNFDDFGPLSQESAATYAKYMENQCAVITFSASTQFPSF